MARRALIALAVVALACDAAQPVGAPAPVIARWSALPVALDVSSELDGCQRAALAAAIAFVETRAGRAVFAPRTVHADALSVSGLPPYGVIGVSLAPLGQPESIAEATLHTQRSDDSALHSVNVRLGRCSPRAFAHELVHAIGLGHGGLGRLMSVDHDAEAWLLEDAELAAALPAR